jgi:hypothetical protein
MWLVMMSIAAHAGGLQSRFDLPRPVAGHAIFDLRLGVDGVVTGDQELRPYVCGELTPFKRVGIEACGNGSGVLHQSDGPDVAHFRLRGAPLAFEDGRTHGMVMVGVGFTEVQRSADRPGFRFGAASEDQVEAAGPEVSVGIKGRYWVSPHSHIAVDLVAGTAYIPGAPTVMGWASPVVPFVSLSTGMGF